MGKFPEAEKDITTTIEMDPKNAMVSQGLQFVPDVKNGRHIYFKIQKKKNLILKSSANIVN